MSDKEKKYVEFKAPVTGWEVFLQARYILLVVVVVIASVILVLYFKVKIEIPRLLTYGIGTFVGVFVLTYLYLGIPEGWALDSLPLSEGRIGLKPLNRYQLERVTETCMMVNSDCGPVALVGHKLYAVDTKTGMATTHPQIEIQLNSEIAHSVAKIQSDMFNDYLLLKSESDLVSMEKYAGAYKAWREKARLDPENMSSSQEPKSAD